MCLHLWMLQERVVRSVSTARPTLTQSAVSAPAACAGGSRTLTCSCCVMSATWRSTSTASTHRWPPSQMTRTGERAPLDILLRDFEPRSHLTRRKGWWVLFKCGLKCISVVIKRWLRVKSIYSNETMRSQVGVNLIFERLSAKQISTPSWHHFLKRRKASLSCVLGSVCFSHSIATKSERLLEKQFRYWLYLVRREDNTNGFENKHF